MPPAATDCIDSERHRIPPVEEPGVAGDDVARAINRYRGERNQVAYVGHATDWTVPSAEMPATTLRDEG